LRAEFLDTTKSKPSNIDVYLSPHKPIGLKLSLRAHIWQSDPLDQMVIYDLVMTNIGDNFLKSARVGLYFDGDVLYDNDVLEESFTDDIAGSFREHAMGYIIDNDGDPVGGQFDPQTSPTRAFAARFLKTSFDPVDTIFNWWVSYRIGALDFGPQHKGPDNNPDRNFGTGGSGTPSGDENKYYILSHPGWDYDQIYTAGILPDDPIWVYPDPEYAADFADGGDTRFTLSVGPINIWPDSSVRVLFTTFTGSPVHSDPNNLSNLPENPDLYYSNLDFTGLLETADIAEETFELLLDPLFPVIGLQTEYQDEDSVVISWDPWVFDDVVGYEIYIQKVPIAKFPYPGVIPPWLKPELFKKVSEVGREYHHRFFGLNMNNLYYINVASRTADGVGDPGLPIVVGRHKLSLPPQPVIDYIIQQSASEVVIEWLPPGDIEVDHYCIYKFENAPTADTIYFPFYDEGYNTDFINPKDTFLIDGKYYYYYAMDRYAEVDGSLASFSDYNVSDSATYIITAVDSDGFESEFSAKISFHRHIPPTRDILLITGQYERDEVGVDTIVSYYERVLNGLDFEIFNYSDQSRFPDCELYNPHKCYDWREFEKFRIVIVDGGLEDWLIFFDGDNNFSSFTRYLLSGGTLIYFGSFGSNKKPGFLSEQLFYEVDNWFSNRFFGLDSIFFMGYRYTYLTFPKPYIDTILGFKSADAVIDGMPDLFYDNTLAHFSSRVKGYWPDGTPPHASAFVANDRGQVTHLFRSKYPEQSFVEGYPVGVKTETGPAVTYQFGFHLWYMETEGARQLIDFIFGNIQTDLTGDEPDRIANQFELEANYPNPFNSSTRINFSLPTQSHITLKVYNILGREVKCLVDETLPAGSHSTAWKGDNNDGQMVSTGVYFYQIKTGKYTETKKMVYLK
jgi:hypothetical protein